MSDFVIPQSNEVITPESSIPQVQQFSEISVGGGPNKFLVTKHGLSIGNTVIVDSEGLNSLNNFRSDTLFDPTNRTTSSTTYEDVPGATLTSFTLTRDARILTYVRASGYHTGYDDNGLNYYLKFRMIDMFDGTASDGVDITGSWALQDININFGASSWTWSSHVQSIETTSISNDIYLAGTHQFKAQFRVFGGGTGNLTEFQIGYVILGI